jgi:rubredoxin
MPVARDGLKKVQERKAITIAFVKPDEANGMTEEGIAPETRWEDVPETWTCPDCYASKSDFQMSDVG